MAAFIERGTCSCVIDALIISVTIEVSTSIHWGNTHEGRGSRTHVFFVSVSNNNNNNNCLKSNIQCT